METRFYCKDPLNTVTRVLDTARRLGLGLGGLTLAREDAERYAVQFVLYDPPDHLARNFLARIRGDLDLEPEQHDA